MKPSISNAMADASSTAVLRPLSVELREETTDLHHEVEQKLGLPDSIHTLAAYRKCLERFYCLYRPLEAALGGFRNWASLGIVLGERAQAGRLAADLESLGVRISQLEDAPLACMPRLPDFAHALGALYVTEGSTLGAQFILPRLAQTLGEEIAEASQFFRGSGAQTGARWQQFRASLDRYGLEHPGNALDVVDGARATFHAIGIWMQS